MTPDQTDAAPPADRRPAGRPRAELRPASRRRGAPRPWAWVFTGAAIGFVVLGVYAMSRPDVNEATGVAYSPTTGVMFMGMFGAFLGALVAALALALVVGRRR